MKNYIQFVLLVFVTVVLTGCAKIQPVLLLKVEDLFWLPFVYLLMSFALAKFLSFGEESKKFWLWFALCLFLTPVVGFIVLIYRVSK